jgi:hypothetical protein
MVHMLMYIPPYERMVMLVAPWDKSVKLIVGILMCLMRLLSNYNKREYTYIYCLWVHGRMACMLRSTHPYPLPLNMVGVKGRVILTEVQYHHWRVGGVGEGCWCQAACIRDPQARMFHVCVAV